jgi:capsular polysaccharide biosynthesis protein
VNWKIYKNGGIFLMTEMQEEEIDLREYISVLIKRKGVIILIFLIAVITAALVSYFALSPVYQSSVVFSIALMDNRPATTIIAQVENNVPVIKIHEALEVINSNLILDEVIKRSDLNISSDQLRTRIEVKNLKNTNFIKVSVEADSPEKAKELAENIVKVFIEKNQNKYTEKIKLIKERIKILEREIAEFEKSIQEIENAIKKIAASKDLSETERYFQTSLLLNSSSNERNLYNNLIYQINTLQERLNNCQDFGIISYAQLPVAPIKPNKKLNILIAGVLGLFVGIFVAFFIEFWQKGK